ncbi:MAG: hypothetical protein A3J35_07175 [Gammaproteobacteria bacterium RIFCSPLOWO2_02_FULL_52_10]|nr:MAG: hypothetical protein A3J35_07175 [Gammaproteobacteria bacterium RIFCSPLOWO2_02_FULL_52_10]
MSERRKLQLRLRQLADIRDIMDAMKNLALAEIFKLNSRLGNQQQIVMDLEHMATDFLSHHPYYYPGNGETIDVWVLFGSERGFCGDFNEALIKNLEQRLQTAADARSFLILVGYKLSRRFAGKGERIRVIAGADVTEEITATLNRIVNSIGLLQAQFHSVNVNALFHDTETGQLSCKQLLPPFKGLPIHAIQHGVPPLMHVPSVDLFSQLVDDYLYFALHEIAYMSLLAENNKRIQHMTGALLRLDERTEELTRQYHLHRQEEITEEIEVILLNTTNI